MMGRNDVVIRQEMIRMRTIFSVAVAIGLAAWIVALQRRLRAAQMRGDMYRDIAARLDRQVVELNPQGP